jgi:hypothetical protein
MKDLNPRYLAYCHANGKTVEEMKAFDEKKYPGGRMCGFIIWMFPLIMNFKKKHPEHCVGERIRDQKAFDNYINDYAEHENSSRVRKASRRGAKQDR